MTTTAMLDKTALRAECLRLFKDNKMESDERLAIIIADYFAPTLSHAAGDVAEPVAWRWRGPQGGWIYDETKPTGWHSEPVYGSSAATTLLALSARAEAAEARVNELEAERDAHKEGRLEAIVEAYPDIAAVIEKIGRVEWGATVEQSDEAHIEDFANTLRLTREHFGTPEQTAKHGVYVEGTGVVVGHTGTSPNSGQHARIIVGMWNELADALAARSLSPIKEAGNGQ